MLPRPPASLPFQGRRACCVPPQVCRGSWLPGHVAPGQYGSCQDTGSTGLAEGVGCGVHGGWSGLWPPVVPFSGPVCSCQLLHELQPTGHQKLLAVGTGKLEDSKLGSKVSSVTDDGLRFGFLCLVLRWKQGQKFKKLSVVNPVLAICGQFLHTFFSGS